MAFETKDLQAQLSSTDIWVAVCEFAGTKRCDGNTHYPTVELKEITDLGNLKALKDALNKMLEKVKAAGG